MAQAPRPLVAFRQEMPWRPLAPLAQAFAAREPGTVFLDSGSDPGDLDARWNVLGWRPTRTLRWPAGKPGALDALRRFLGEPRLPRDPSSPAPYRGGVIGWIGYDIGRHIERLPARHAPSAQVPDFALAEYESLLVEDRRDRRLFLSGACDPREGPSRLLVRQSEALEAFAAIPDDVTPSRDPPADPPVADIARDEYLRRVERVLEYIRAGDVFQANLAQRFTTRLHGSAWGVYSRLRAASPAPYGCWMDLGGPAVLSVSPEQFLERRGERVTTRPIKGTRARSGDPREDARLRAELECSEKERAELAMIVDLLRNDLGRVARTGTVRVDDAREIREHPTVFHAAATISAALDDDVHAVDLLRATVPGGSVTGAPKIRAMEILEELEDSRRGPYCGAAGWFGYDGDLVTNILIRTVVVDGGVVDGGVVDGVDGDDDVSGDRASFHVGGGIVADSDPDAEYEETLAKARALIDALSGRAA